MGWPSHLRQLFAVPFRRLLRVWWWFQRRPDGQHGPKRVLLCAFNELMTQYIGEVHRVLSDDKRLTFYFTSPTFHTHKGSRGSALAQSLNLPYVGYVSARMKWWDLIIFPTPSGAIGFHPQIPKILCTHYTAAGKLDKSGEDLLYGSAVVRGNRCLFDRVFEASEATRDIAVANNPCLEGHMVAVGDLRVDHMLDMQDRRAQIRQELRVGDNDQVVLIQSTWGEDSLIERMGSDLLAEIKRLSANGSYRFVISVHPNYWGNSRYAIQHPWGERCLAVEGDGILVKRPEDPWENLHVASDLAISDHTSLVAAYALLHKPLFLLPLREGVLFEGAIVEQLSRVVPQFFDASALQSVIDHGCDDYPLDKIREICPQIVSYPREAAQRMRREVYDVLSLPMLR